MDRWNGTGNVTGGSGGDGKEDFLREALEWDWKYWPQGQLGVQAGPTGHVEFDQTAPSLLKS